MRADGFQPLTAVTITLFSDPVELARTTTDAAGQVDEQVTIPTAVPPGEHNLVVAGTATNGQARSISRGLTIKERQGPEVVSLAASPSSVAPHGAVTITAQVTDATGVESVGFYFLLDGVQRDFCGQQMERTGGTSQDGTWTYECAGPALVQNGEYEVVPYATDVVGQPHQRQLL